MAPSPSKIKSSQSERLRWPYLERGMGGRKAITGWELFVYKRLLDQKRPRFCLMDKLKLSIVEEIKKAEDVTSAPTKKCPYCQKEVDARAIKCPYCQSKIGESEVPQSYKTGRTALIVGVILFFLILCVWAGVESSANQQANNNASSTGTVQSVAASNDQIQQVTNTIGTLAGSENDVADMITRLNESGLNSSDVVTVTTELGEALKITGGDFSPTFDTDFMTYLQATGAKTADQMEELISNLMSATQASGGTISGIQELVDNTKDFALAAQDAGVSFNAINTSIVRYGVESKISVAGAKGGIKVMTEVLSNNNLTATQLFGTPAKMADKLNTDVNSAWDDMNAKIASLPQ